MQKKIIFFDVDDTIYDNKNRIIPQGVKKSLQLLKANGYQLCLATGRELFYIPNPVLALYSWDGYICCNGQCIYDKQKRILRQIFFDDASLKACMALADKTQSTLEFRSTRGNFVYNTYTDAFEKACAFLNRPLWPKDGLKTDDQIVMMLIARDKNQDYTDFMSIPTITVAPTAHCYADINSCMCSKYEGIQYYMKLFGYDTYTAIGDSMNDYEMLRHAQCSIAMGNAQSELKTISDYVTASASKQGIEKAVAWMLNMNKSCNDL